MPQRRTEAAASIGIVVDDITGALLNVRLVSRSVEQEGFHRADQEQDIQPHRPVAYVTRVHLYSFTEESAVAPGDLPWAGDPWRYAQYLALRNTDLLGLARQVGSGANQAHLPPQHVPELWQLVQAGPAQESADARNARIVAQLVVLRILFPERSVFFQHFLQQSFSVRDHGAELDARE